MTISLDLQIAASTDDALRRYATSYYSRTSVYQAAGGLDTYSRFCGGYRFLAVTIPRGATITAATLRFKAKSSDAGTACKTKIRGERADNAATFPSSSTDFDARFPYLCTTAYVYWGDNTAGIPAWTADTEYTSPDFKSVIQEITDQPGWVSGNALVLYWDDNDDRSPHNAGNYRRAWSYDNTPTTNGAKLHIEYTLPTPVFWRRWFGPADAPAKVQWDGDLETLGAVAPNKVHIDMPTGSGPWHCSGWASDVNRAYFGTIAEHFHLYRFNPADNTYSTYTDSGAVGAASGMWITGGKVFVAKLGDDAHVCVFLTSTDPPELVGDYACATGAGWAEAISSDGTHLFVATHTGNLIMVRISDMALLDTIALPGYSGVPQSVIYNPSDGKVYATEMKQPQSYAWQVSLNGEAFNHGTVVSVLCPQTISRPIACDANYLYCPVEYSAYGRIMRIPISPFANPETFIVGPAANCYGIWSDMDGTHLLTAWAASPGQFRGIKISDMTVDGICWFADAETECVEIVQYSTKDFLIGCYANPYPILNLTDVFPAGGMDKPASGYDYSYWASIRAFIETTPGVSIGGLDVYTDGVNGLGTGWSALGGVATNYTEPTGTPTISGDVLNTTNYPTLEAAPVDIFGWVYPPPKVIDGSLANPNVGDIGIAGTDHCFLVLQLRADNTVAEGLSAAETLTLQHDDGTAHAFSQTVQFRGYVVRLGELFQQALSGALTSTGAVATVSARLKSIAGALSPTGSLARASAKSIAGALSPTGTLLAAAAKIKSLAGVVTPTGAVASVALKAVAGTFSSAGAVIKLPQKALAGALNSGGAFSATKLLLKSVAGALTSVGGLGHPGTATQYGLPTGDISHATWTQGAGDGDADAFDELDEGFGTGRGSGSGPDDATTYWTTAATADLICGINAVTDPTVGSSHYLRAQVCKSATGGRQLDITLRLLEGATVRATETWTAFNIATWTTLTHTLTTAEANSITDYSALRVEVYVVIGGGSARSCYLSAIEFECPGVAGSSGLQVWKALTAAFSPTGALATVSARLKSLAGVLTPGGALSTGGAFPKSIAGVLTSSGAVAKVAAKVKSVAGAMISVGSLSAMSARLQSLAGALNPTGALTAMLALRQSVSGALASAGELITSSTPIQAIAGVLTSSGAVDSLKVLLRSVDGTLTSAGALVKLPQKALSGVLSPTGAVAAIAARLKGIGGALSPTGALVARALKLKSLLGVMTSSGSLGSIKVLIRSVTGTLTSSGAVARQAQKALAGALSPTGNLDRVTAFLKTVAGAFSPTGALSAAALKVQSLAGVLTSSGVITNLKVRVLNISGSFTGMGSLARMPGKALSGIMASSGDLTRSMSVTVAGVLTSAGGITRRITKGLVGVLSAAGTVVRRLLPGGTADTLTIELTGSYVNTIELSGSYEPEIDLEGSYG